jgi:hypothetical protein
VSSKALKFGERTTSEVVPCKVMNGVQDALAWTRQVLLATLKSH